MAHKHHTWQIGQDPPTIRVHSLAKHRVLRAYLEQYVAVLTVNPKQEQLRLTLVDGFAGGGRYLDSQREVQPGSPLIMLEAMRDAEARARQNRSKPFLLDVDYFFVEKNANAVEYLKMVLAESDFRQLLADRIHVLHHDFVNVVPAIVDSVKQRGRAGRTIFVLDQFGYSDVPLGTIRSIFQQLENAEVILTFAVDSLIDYLNTSAETQGILEKIDVALPSHMIGEAKERIGWRRKIQFLLHREIPEKTGARYYTPFFIRSPDSHRDFWLIHLSGHYRARDVMVGLHWKENTSFVHYGGSGLQMLGYDQATDRALNAQSFLPGFFFDATALESSRESLIQQLPERVADFAKGVSFKGFFAQVTNDCPVTFQAMREVMSELSMEGVIQVRDAKGGTKRKARISSSSDIILPSPQKRLFLPRDF